MTGKLRTKQHLEDLAIFGGAALVSSRHKIGEHLDLEAFLDSVRGIYQRRHLTNNGPLVRELERRLADRHQTKHCIAVATRGLALSMVLQVRGSGRSGSVLMPAIGSPELPYAARWAGLMPVFADVDQHAQVLDLDDARSRVSLDTRCLLAVPPADTPDWADAAWAFARQHGLPIVLDSTDTLSAHESASRRGSRGDAEIFSLSEASGVLGVDVAYITTDDDGLAYTLSRQRDFNAAGREPTDLRGPQVLGLNGKLNEFHAAVGLLALDQRGIKSGASEDRRRELFSLPAGISLATGSQEARQDVAGELRLRLRVAPSWVLSAAQTVELLKQEGLNAQPCYPLHHLAPWSAHATALPVAEGIAEACFNLAVGASDRDLHGLASLMEFLGARRSEIAARMATCVQ
jgi:dTDP-4-amino-4,6-dideoxygalactose transaminase